MLVFFVSCGKEKHMLNIEKYSFLICLLFWKGMTFLEIETCYHLPLIFILYEWKPYSSDQKAIFPDLIFPSSLKRKLFHLRKKKEEAINIEFLIRISKVGDHSLNGYINVYRPWNLLWYIDMAFSLWEVIKVHWYDI